ncbi:MAG: class I SAM-dependent methyltransferase [Spirochaetales bacterium]|nr:class I SAM-dependent methyltransferase [Spirochaetales bacterium]
MRYTFGTSEKAADRLKQIGAFFNPVASALIKRFFHGPAGIALDLGCGPGFTTHMLEQSTLCRRIYGFDLSDDFLKLARKRFPTYHFFKHDVTVVPFPVRADIIYARFLLSHLKNAVSTVDNWAGELNNGGILFVEEVEDIFTDVGVFKDYLHANCGLIDSQGAELFIGKTLGKAAYKNYVMHNESVLLPVLNRQAADWFYPNTITIWESEDFIRNTLTPSKRKKISAELKKIMTGKNHKSDITWKMRRVVIRKET